MKAWSREKQQKSMSLPERIEIALFILVLSIAAVVLVRSGKFAPGVELRIVPDPPNRFVYDQVLTIRDPYTFKEKGQYFTVQTLLANVAWGKNFREFVYRQDNSCRAYYKGTIPKNEVENHADRLLRDKNLQEVAKQSAGDTAYLFLTDTYVGNRGIDSYVEFTILKR